MRRPSSRHSLVLQVSANFSDVLIITKTLQSDAPTDLETFHAGVVRSARTFRQPPRASSLTLEPERQRGQNLAHWVRLEARVPRPNLGEA